MKNTFDGLKCIDGFEECGEIDSFDVGIKSFEESQADFAPYRRKVGTDFDINARGEQPSFFGWVRYSFDVDLSKCEGLKLEYSGDGCEIRIGDELFVGVNGTVWCLPKAENAGILGVTVDLLNSQAYGRYDIFSTFDALRPCMLKQVKMIKRASEGR